MGLAQKLRTSVAKPWANRLGHGGLQGRALGRGIRLQHLHHLPPPGDHIWDLHGRGQHHIRVPLPFHHNGQQIGHIRVLQKLSKKLGMQPGRVLRQNLSLGGGKGGRRILGRDALGLAYLGPQQQDQAQQGKGQRGQKGTQAGADVWHSMGLGIDRSTRV